MEPRQFLSSGVVVAAWPAKVAIRVTRGSRARRRLKPKHAIQLVFTDLAARKQNLAESQALDRGGLTRSLRIDYGCFHPRHLCRY